MTLPVSMAWEIRPTTGNDTNGGGFDLAQNGIGTDYSIFDSPKAMGVSPLTSITTNVITFISIYSPVAGDVGNVVNFASGTNVTPGRYVITSVVPGTSWTVDRNVVTSGTTVDAVFKMGGSAATIPSVMGDVAASGTGGNKFWVKAQSGIATTASILLNAPSATVTATVMPTRFCGYTTTRGDRGMVTITLSTTSAQTVLLCSTNGWIIENFTIDCGSVTTSVGITASGTTVMIRNCKVSNFTSKGINAIGNTNEVYNCEVTGGTSATTAALILGSSAYALWNDIHDCSCPGVTVSTATVFANNLIDTLTGTVDGVQPNAQAVILNNIFYNIGRHGINQSNANQRLSIWKNNIFHTCTTTGIVAASALGSPADFCYDGNAFFACGANRTNMDDTGTTTPINASSPYTNSLDVLLGADPFVNAAGGDFTLKANAASLLHAAPGTLLGNATANMGVMGTFGDASGGSSGAGGGVESVYRLRSGRRV